MGINGRTMPDRTFPGVELALQDFAGALTSSVPKLTQQLTVSLAGIAMPKPTTLTDVMTASVGFSLADFADIVSKTLPPLPVLTPDSALMKQLAAITAPLTQEFAQSSAQSSPLADIIAVITESLAARVDPLSAEPVRPPVRRAARLSPELAQLRQWLNSAPWPHVVAFCLLLSAWVAAGVEGEGPTSPEQLTRLAGAVLIVGSVQRHHRQGAALPSKAERTTKLVDNHHLIPQASRAPESTAAHAEY